MTGEVSVVGDGTISVTSQMASDGSNTPFGLTVLPNNVIGGNIIGVSSGASYAIIGTDDFNTMDESDAFAQNEEFNSIGDNFIDFSELNPFGDPRYPV